MLTGSLRHGKEHRRLVAQRIAKLRRLVMVRIPSDLYPGILKDIRNQGGIARLDRTTHHDRAVELTVSLPYKSRMFRPGNPCLMGHEVVTTSLHLDINNRA